MFKSQKVWILSDKNTFDKFIEMNQSCKFLNQIIEQNHDTFQNLDLSQDSEMQLTQVKHDSEQMIELKKQTAKSDELTDKSKKQTIKADEQTAKHKREIDEFNDQMKKSVKEQKLKIDTVN